MSGKFIKLPISGEAIDFSDQKYSVAFELPRVNAVFFEQYWLKYFREGGFDRYVENHPDETREALDFRHRWVEIARGYYTEVEIVDNEGEVLCVVPGLYSRIKTITDNDSAILESAALRLKNPTHVARAENEFDNTASSLDFKLETDVNDIAARWKQVLSIDYTKLKREQVSKTLTDSVDSLYETSNTPEDYDLLFS